MPYRDLRDYIAELDKRDLLQVVDAPRLHGESCERWAELGLPALNLSDPWHGYPLSNWTEENADKAEKAHRLYRLA